MSIALFVIGIILCGIATLITLVFTIISISNGKNGNAGAWGAGFAVSLCGLIACIFFTVHTISDKVQSGLDWVKDQEKGGMYNNDPNDQVDYKSGDRANFLDTLKSYTSEIHEGKVPADFYENKKADSAADGTIIVPFLFPYSIKYDAVNYTGDIINKENGKEFASNISQMAFDKNFVIAKVDNSSDDEALKAGKGEVEYILFDMRTGEYETFTNQQKLLEMADKIGYTGSQLMNYLSDDYTGWIEYQDYD